MPTQLPNTILIIEDDEDVRNSLRLYLKMHFEKILTANNAVEINQMLSTQEIHLVLLDMNLKKGINDGKEGLYWLKHIQEVKPITAVVLLTAYGSVELAVESLKLGASDFVIKPWDNQKLLATLLRALEVNSSRRKVKQLEAINKVLGKENSGSLLLGSKSTRMQQILQTAQIVASTDANILITGENGTGKEVMARFIHENSNRYTNPFISLDIGSLSENLFESELFGYKKGAFTDAKEDKAGRFELAEGGTLFLDEIGNIPISLQSKLLTIIQNKTFTAVGSTIEKQIDCRIIFATNMDLKKAVEENNFRQDLYYRINTIELNLPALRERKEDIPELSMRFLENFNKKYNRNAKLSYSAIEALINYSWPGNIRELQHLIERNTILSQDNEIKAADLHLSNINLNSSFHYENDNKPLSLEEIEERHIHNVLLKCDGNISHAAKILDINRNTLYRKIEKYGLQF